MLLTFCDLTKGISFWCYLIYFKVNPTYLIFKMERSDNSW